MNIEREVISSLINDNLEQNFVIIPHNPQSIPPQTHDKPFSLQVHSQYANIKLEHEIQ